MKRIVFAFFGLLLMTASIILAGSSVSHAKVNQSHRQDFVIYVRELAPEVAPKFSDTVLLAMGKRVCKDYRRGLPEDSIAETIERIYLNNRPHFNFSARILQASQLYFCPKYL